MITCSAPFKAHLSQPEQTTTTCWLVRLRDNSGGTPQVRGYTSLDRALTFDLEAWMVSMSLVPPPGIAGTGSVTYNAMVGYSPSDIAGAADLSPDNLEVDGILSSPSLTEADLNSGVWDYASVTIFWVNYEDLTMGALILRSGKLGEVVLERDTYKAELRGLTQMYSRTIGRLTAPGCPWDLGDRHCKVRMTVPTWTALTAYSAITSGDAALGSEIGPTAYNARYFRCTTTGTSGATEPSWNLTVGGTTADGSVVWTTIYARTTLATVTAIGADNMTIGASALDQPGPSGAISITAISKANPGVVTTASPLGLSNGAAVTIFGALGMTQVNGDTFIYSPSGSTFNLAIDTTSFPTYTGGGMVVPLGGTAGYFDYGVVTWLTGLNTGLSMEVKTYSPGQLVLQLPMPRQIALTDTFSVTVGCAKALIQDCKTKFDNVFNMGGQPYLPGIDRLIQVGKQPGAGA